MENYNFNYFYFSNTQLLQSNLLPVPCNLRHCHRLSISAIVERAPGRGARISAHVQIWSQHLHSDSHDALRPMRSVPTSRYPNGAAPINQCPVHFFFIWHMTGRGSLYDVIALQNSHPHVLGSESGGCDWPELPATAAHMAPEPSLTRCCIVYGSIADLAVAFRCNQKPLAEDNHARLRRP